VSLIRSASIVSLLTLASRITGLARDLLMAAVFGVSGLTDAFNVAFRIPNLMRRLFAEGAFSQAFVPVLASSKARRGDAATQVLIDAVATVLVAALILVSIAGVIGAPVLMWVLASGLKESEFAAGVLMTRVMVPYIACMSLGRCPRAFSIRGAISPCRQPRRFC
jgi:putative peptidoglycan lipid II flippase